jgi:protein involved in polysaccharide export with SLBB domain
MKNINIIFILLLSTIFAQVSMSDLNKLSNEQLDSIKAELQSNTKQDNLVENDGTEVNNTVVPVQITPAEIQDEINFLRSQIDMFEEEKEKEFFGYNYFKKENISFFDNIPTPADYKLGPGDEIIISLWGENNSRESVTLNKDGMIYYKNIGFINLSNKTLKSAEILLTEELSRIYSTLKDKNNPTTLMLELGQLKSINIYFSGHIENPGINLVHPFSDIFSAIVQAGGINSNGSLRAIQLIRNDQIITTVDFYSFFINGTNTFSNIKLIDGDTVHIPSFKNRISILGEVNRPSTYELLSNEFISDIIGYAAGFTSDASSTIVLNQIIPVEERYSDDNARTSIALNFKNSKSTPLNNGDSIEVLSIPNVEVNVEIFGRVKSPGVYPASNSSLKHILDIAGGFDDPIFRQTIRENEITVLRKDSNQFYATELITSYNEADKLQLLPNDKIFVYENINYRNSFTYRIEGEVNKPGTYSFKEGISVSDAIELAEGITSLSSFDNIVVFQEFTELDENDEEITKSESVGNVDRDFLLGSNSVVVALPFENVVRVEGNVYNPGLVAFSRGLTMYRAIEQAGGYKPYSIKNRTYVRRADGEIEKASLFRGRSKRIYPGDTIVVPVDPNPSDFDITTFVSDISTTLANIAAILLIVDNQTN